MRMTTMRATTTCTMGKRAGMDGYRQTRGARGARPRVCVPAERRLPGLAALQQTRPAPAKDQSTALVKVCTECV